MNAMAKINDLSKKIKLAGLTAVEEALPSFDRCYGDLCVALDKLIPVLIAEKKERSASLAGQIKSMVERLGATHYDEQASR
jgi:hypothetical protein